MKKLLWLSIVCIACACTNNGSIADLRSEFVDVDSCRVHYKVCGEGPAIVVFVHGFGCDMNTWENQYREFRGEDGLRMVFVDLPGYGLSGKPQAEYTLQYFADAVTAVLDEIGAGDVVLVGHSLGTPVCRQVLLSGARRGGLVDIDGVYCFYGDSVDPEHEAAVQGFASSFDGPGCRSVIEGFVQSLKGPDTPEEVTRYAMATMPETPEYVASGTMHNLVERIWWDGTSIGDPVVVICTRNSGLDPDNREKMETLYPSLDYTELDSCGHFIQMEQPQLVNSKIRELLRNVFGE